MGHGGHVCLGEDRRRRAEKCPACRAPGEADALSGRYDDRLHLQAVSALQLSYR